MGIMSALFGSPVDDVKAALAKFDCPKGFKETRFRDELTKHLGRTLAVMPKREAGITGQGTRVDFFFEHSGEDFVFSIKNGLSEQKVKTLLGECLIISSSLQLNSHPRWTNIVLLLAPDEREKEEAFDGFLNTLLEALAYLNAYIESRPRARIRFHVAKAFGGDPLELLSF